MNKAENRRLFMKDETKVVTAGRDPEQQFGAVNPPVVHASTIVFPTVADARRIEREGKLPVYGRFSTPTDRSLEEAVAEIEGGYRTALCPSGLAAVSLAILSYVSSGDHLLLSDSVYGPTRGFCLTALKRFGVETTIYDPLIGAGIEQLIKPNTKAIFVESPGSRTFEVQDVPAIAAVAKSKGEITVISDNTWASPLYFKPFEHGVDVSLHAGTKYIVGHSDAMLGVVTTTEEHWQKLADTHAQLGYSVGPDDVYLGQRGLRTLSVRLERHGENAMALIAWLLEQPEVARILYPAWPTDPGYTLWKRDFLGATGLFGFVLHGGDADESDHLIETLEHFGFGYSWGGYESLIIPNKGVKRTASTWSPEGMSFRIHAGLEHIDDLIEDMDKGFHALRRMRKA